MHPINFQNTLDLLTQITQDKADNYSLLGIFMRELSPTHDELLVIVQKDGLKKIYTHAQSNQEAIPNISDIFYDAFMYQNEIYDFYGKPTAGVTNYTLRLHLSPNTYFPKRKIGKPMIQQKNPYIFTKIQGDGLTEVQVGPIHAGVIPPGHFRFMVDGEDTLNLDTQMGWKHRGVESYFMQETDLNKLLVASQEIAGDSAVAYATTFAKLIEKSANITIDESAKYTRVLLMELERIYNHLWTLGALTNDVGQAMLLNGFLTIREEILELNQKIFGSRTLKHTITLGGVSHTMSAAEQKLLITHFKAIHKRLQNLIELSTMGEGNYDRFKDTGIVHPETARSHGALGVSARASTLSIDERQYDPYYVGLPFRIALGLQGDSLDRFNVRAHECFNSIDIIIDCANKLDIQDTKSKDKNQKTPPSIKLSDGVYLSTSEGHRGQIAHIATIEGNKIVYFKVKDPSFVNWNLLEYAVLNNIIADFPICNKSFDLSYSGFDL